MLAGLDTHSAGDILIRRGADPKKPLNSVVFQEYAVFPWKTVVENVAFGLQMRGVGKSERLETAHYWLERVGLRKFAHYYPSQISGGMKQRVSIVRALANDPECLLMDDRWERSMRRPASSCRTSCFVSGRRPARRSSNHAQPR